MELTPGTFLYRTTILMMGRETVLETSVTVAPSEDGWRVEEVTSSGADTALLAAGSLSIRKRLMTAGPTRLEMDFADGRVSGTFFMMNGQTKSIDAEIGGELFAYGPGAAQSIAALPLADGYSTTLRTFDIATQAVSLSELRVTGIEDDAFVVEVTPGEWTLRIARETRTVLSQVRSKAGASLLSVLTSPIN
jgi:hypothetical protein